LVGYWPLDGNGADVSGNGRDLTLFGNPTFAPGGFGLALSLHDDKSQYAQRPVDDAAFDFGNGSDFTIQVWVNFNTTRRDQTLLEKTLGASGPGWRLRTLYFGGQGHWSFTDPSLNMDTSPQNIQPGV
jgi:hypothetical protein